jgi:hypothetical protein
MKESPSKSIPEESVLMSDPVTPTPTATTPAPAGQPAPLPASLLPTVPPVQAPTAEIVGPSALLPAVQPAPQTALPTAPASAASRLFTEHEAELFELYTRFRFNELVGLHLSREAAKLEKWVRRSVVGVLAISLFTPVIPGMDQASLKWVWEFLTGLATMLGIYSMIVSSGAKQFEWFRRATRFRTWASKVESFSAQVKRGKVTEDEFDEAWNSYIHELNRLVEEGGIEFDEYVNRCRTPLTDELKSALRAESKLK